MRVLVVDDEPSMRLVVRAALLDVEVVEAANAPTALRIIEHNDIDLVLLDIMLPGMDGLSLLDCLRAEPRTADLPVVILTAKAGEDDHLLAYRHGADGYLVKPFDVTQLAGTVARVGQRTRTERRAARETELRRAELLSQLEVRFGA